MSAVVLMEIAEILKKANRSVDFPHMNGLDWTEIFEEKVSAWRFDGIVDEIRDNGFGMPIVLCDRYNDGSYWIGNGHHRLCAAILLGLWRIPVILSEGQDRDDFMRENDSADDYGRPINGIGQEYWGMLCANMPERGASNEGEVYVMGGYNPTDDDSDRGSFYCDNCLDYYRVSDYCCIECHNVDAHAEPTVNECSRCQGDLNDGGHLLGCPERDWEIIGCVPCDEGCVYRFAHYACEIAAVWDEAHSEDYGYEAERALYVAVRAMDDNRAGAWHPMAILDEAYEAHAVWQAGEDMREAREARDAALRRMREAFADGVGPYRAQLLAQQYVDACAVLDALQ